MDVLTEQEVRVRSAATASQLPLYAAALLYGVLVCAAAVHHEPWADEAQSWLLARDSSIFALWTRLLHYEGSTGLWQTLLHGLISAGLPYRAINVLSGMLGLGAVCVVLWRAPLPLAIRAALPFTFFLCYQYSVIARSYVLLPLLLFSCAAIYTKAQERPWLFTALLCLMAAVSVHGVALAVAVGLSALVRYPAPKRFVLHAGCFAAVVLLLAASAIPAHDGTFIAGLNLSFDHFIGIAAKAFATAFTGESISSVALVALSLPLLWRGGGWLFFVLSAILLCGIASVVYSQVWHHGALFLAWLFAIWISVNIAGRRSCQLALAALAVVVTIQAYWTACSIEYDWRHAYSGSRQAAQGIRELNLEGRRLYAIGFACTAIQPYFPHNIFANVNDGRQEAYWDWSLRNHVNQDSEHLAESRPDYVIVGYKNEFERGIWTHLVRKSGYQAIRHFEGHTFWQTSVLEPESYDLYQRSAAP